ncbi:F-box protein At3g07870-like [Corylus avellana]|uniref:F-box protein At3g07870-like n=1 Tax=Corylus avellana TaxID=13451 RepID=UPI001E21BA52|nr:F-box protein At3g07870-like [Corylus avellana]XP_059455624.1 F-box protein At3g07870-like [Corylus avellana]XP_059455631.1 F-box protein At3g07870-like [Corylus avellana]XP_059455640.1 F-box protein At3g07870-like [Corylus avellana]
MSVYLPEELVVKILSTLPTKSLIRFRCVSKSWHEILGNLDFLSQNLLNLSILAAPENPNHSLLLVRGREKSDDENDENDVFSFLSYETLDCLSQIAFTTFLSFTLVGSCKGLLCIYNVHTGGVYLWNPVTPFVGLKALPPMPERANSFGSGFGFGFDSRFNDFKVVRIRSSLLQGEHLQSHVEVFSLNAGSWRVIDLPEPMLPFWGNRSSLRTVALDGVFIWWMLDHKIAAFDFSDELLRLTPLPDASHLHLLSQDNGGSSIITLLNGHVALLAFSGSKMNATRSLEIWVLLEFGVKESWTILTTIGLPMDLERPLGFWKSGQLFIENSEGQLVLYDPFAQSTKNLQIIDATKRSFQIVLYKPSSIAVNP